MPKTSIIVPVSNRSIYLDYTLSGFLNQSDNDFEVIVIDDGSTDNIKNVLDKYADKLNVVYTYQEKAQSASKARNRGLQIANGKFIINIDSDRIPSPVFIEEHLKVLNEHVNTISVGSKHCIFSIYSRQVRFPQSFIVDILKKNNGMLNFLDDTRPLFTPHELVENFYEVVERNNLYEPPDNFNNIIKTYSESLAGFHFGWVLSTGGNMAYIREEDENNKFDENFVGWGVQDSDFSYNFHKKGYKFYFNNKALNYHQEHPRDRIKESEQLWNNLKYFINKHKDSIEVYLWSRIFLYEKNYNLMHANEIYKNLIGINNTNLIEDYIELNKLKLQGKI